MINLSKHIVEIDGKKYVPYEIAVEATTAVQADADKIDKAMQDLHTNLMSISGIINTPIEDD